MDLIRKYFELNERQLGQLQALEPLYADWNEKINVISRKDMGNFYVHHVLHSLSIAKYIQFVPQTNVLDVGTGGGFPGIPLAIVFPDSHFHLVDGIGKKIKVVQSIAEAIDLQNVKAEQIRAESLKQQYDFIVSRAVTALPEFIQWTAKRVHKISRNNKPNGIIYLKGGDLTEELHQLPKRWVVQQYPIKKWFDETNFDTKALIHIY